MARKPPQKQAPAANDVAPNATGGHPWFPETAPEKIAKLVVKRVAYEDRKGLPGAGTSVKTTMTAEPVPPSMLTTEAQIAQAFGPGYYEVWAMDAANRFACGAPYVVEIAGEGGAVPKYVRQFEDDEEEATQAGMSEAEKVLRLHLEQERRLRVDERGFWEKAVDELRRNSAQMLEAQQRANTANFEAVSGLVDRVVQAQAAMTATTTASGRDEWLMKRLERAEELQSQRAEELRELAVKNARRHTGDGDGDGWWGLLEKGAPLLGSAWTEYKELQEKKLKLEEEKLRRRRSLPEGGIVVRGVPFPSLDKMRAKLESEPLPEDMRVLFRGMIRDGMLPRAYEELLTPYLRETDRESGETPG